MIVALAGSALIKELRRHFELIETRYPPEINPRDRRKIKRLEPISDPIEFDLVHADGRRQTALLADISVRGARIVADDVPAPGEIVELLFPTGETTLAAEAEVVHTGHEEDEIEAFFGVRFLGG